MNKSAKRIYVTVYQVVFFLWSTTIFTTIFLHRKTSQNNKEMKINRKQARMINIRKDWDRLWTTLLRNLKMVSVTFHDEPIVPLDGVRIQPYIMMIASPFSPWSWRWTVFYSHGCQAGSIRHKLSGLVAAAIRVVTLVSPPSYWARSEKINREMNCM